MTSDDLQLMLIEFVAERLKWDSSKISLQQDLGDLGLKSLDAVIVSGKIEDALGMEIEPSMMFEHRSITAITLEIERLQAENAR